MTGRAAWVLALALAGAGCTGLRQRGAELGRAAAAGINQSPELRREIAYAAVDAFKDAAVARFASHRQVADQDPPTFFRLTRCDPIERKAGSSFAVISAVVHGDGYQNRTFRGRVDFTFELHVTTSLDFAVDWDGRRAVLQLDPQFTALRIQHDYTRFAALNDLLTKLGSVESKALTELQRSAGGPQRWVVAKIDGAWSAKREPSAR